MPSIESIRLKALFGNTRRFGRSALKPSLSPFVCLATFRLLRLGIGFPALPPRQTIERMNYQRIAFPHIRNGSLKLWPLHVFAAVPQPYIDENGDF
jgi:hypothetical protein